MTESLENIQGYPYLELIANQVVEGFITGLHKSPFHGFSVEFAEHRLYNSGESVRNVDWKLYAKSEKLFVKKFEEETNLRCLIVLDHSSSMLYPQREKPSFQNPNKLFFSIYASAVLTQMLYKQRDAFGLALLSDKIDNITDISSSFSHKRHIFSSLEKEILQKDSQERKTTKITPFLHEIAERIHKRSLIIIFTDLFSWEDENHDLIQSLQHLKHSKHEIILFHVNSHSKEIDLDFENRQYRFMDMETREEIKLNPVEIQDNYRKIIEEKIKEIKNSCGQMKIDFIDADINKGFDQILIPYLIKRIKMR